MFPGEQERKFIDYITTASNMHYSVSRKEVMELAYEFVKETKTYLSQIMGHEWACS
jgi:hypothetical protein